MKKVISVLLAVLCLALVITTSVSALAYDSFSEGDIGVIADDTNTDLDKNHTPAGSDDDKAIQNNPTAANLAGAVPGFPSTSSNDVTLVGNFFEVTSTGQPKFTVESDKIVAGVQVGVAHYSTTRNVWEFVAASSVNTANHTASFTLADGSPVILVVYKAKTTPASGVVNTATK